MRYWFASSFFLTITLPALAQVIQPLPPWYFYGGGTGATWDGSSSSPDNAQLTVTLYSPPVFQQYGTGVATSSSDVAQISPLTTYTLTLSAMVAGSGSAQALFVDEVAVITNISTTSAGWTRYTNSFTTGTPNDPRVGRKLNIQLMLSRFSNIGTVTANFTNIQFRVTTVRPTLVHHVSGPGLLQLRWPTNFYWYIPEQTTNLESGSWELMTNTPVVQANQFMIEVEREPGRGFFRLRQP